MPNLKIFIIIFYFMATAIVAVRVRENQSVAENLLNINPNFAKLAHTGPPKVEVLPSNYGYKLVQLFTKQFVSDGFNYSLNSIRILQYFLIFMYFLDFLLIWLNCFLTTYIDIQTSIISHFLCSGHLLWFSDVQTHLLIWSSRYLKCNVCFEKHFWFTSSSHPCAYLLARDWFLLLFRRSL